VALLNSERSEPSPLSACRQRILAAVPDKRHVILDYVTRMANPFSRTCRSLANDTSRYAFFAWGLAALLFAAWLGWLLFGRVTVYVLSDSARLEVTQAAHPIAALLPGKILSTSVQLGRHVEAGEVLVEFDARSERLRLKEEEARLSSIPPQLQALRRQLADEEQAATQAQAAASSAVEQARARRQEADAAAGFAEETLRRITQLSVSGRVAEIEVSRARAEAMKARSAAEALSFEIKRLSADALGKVKDRSAALESLRQDIAELQGQSDLTTATIERLREEIEKHIIRAPVAGEIGEAPQLDVGAYVDEGGVLASIVPTGKLRAVADFAPAQVVGRVAPGQSARMRLDGFPWAQFGVVTLKVERVASEIRDGHIRVELSPDPQGSSKLLRHGLPGSVEVAIERTTPVSLVLRVVGQTLSRPMRADEQSARLGR